MSEEQQRCQATTKAGTQCKNTVQEGSSYCHVHQSWAEKASDVSDVAPVPAPTASPTSGAGEAKRLSPDDKNGNEQSARLQIHRFKQFILGRETIR